MIFETIIISSDEKNVPHVAPFGIQYDGNRVLIAPFKPSKTFDNILTSKVATLNVTDDVRVFAGALTDRTPWQLQPSDHVKGFRLQDCLMHAELKLVDIRQDEVRPQLLMEQVSRQPHGDFKGFNRAQAAVIELAVLTSRLHLLTKEKIQTEMHYLQIAIDKTAGKREREAWAWLVGKIQQFNRNNSL